MMSSLALINEFLGQPPNASEHGYQIDHILEFAHWFMGALFLGWSAFFVFVLIRFRRSRHPKADHTGVRSGISTRPGHNCRACCRPAVQLELSFAGTGRPIRPARCQLGQQLESAWAGSK